MNPHHKRIFPFLLAGLLLVQGGVQLALGQAPPKPKPAPAQQQPEPQEEYTEEEYDAYEKATQEPDPDKRAAALIAFMEKYPKSKLQQYIVHSYKTLLADYQKNKNYAKLGPAAEQWLKYEPKDLTTIAYIADSARELGNDKKFVEYGQKVYAEKPASDLAYLIAQSYKKMGDQAKYEEWIEKTFSDPKYAAGEIDLRIEAVDKFVKEKNFAKASENAQLVLKAVEKAKRPDKLSEADWQKRVSQVKRSSHYIVGVNLYDKDKYAEAIQSLEQALKQDHRYAPAYYYIGLSQWKLDKVEDAMTSFAKACILKSDEVSGQAKEHLEKLHKALHNNTLIGIDKAYNRAEKELNAERTSK